MLEKDPKLYNSWMALVCCLHMTIMGHAGSWLLEWAT